MSLHIRPISPFAHPGMPLIYDSCWDYGGGILGSVWRLEYQVMLTQGTLSDPSASAVDDNDSGQLVARLGIVPFTGALVRLSWARGAYLNNAVSESLATGTEVEDFNQKIAGVAVEYEIRHLVVVAEWARNRWESPFIVDAGGGAEDLEVTGSYLEARYKLASGLYVAGRYSALHFGDIDDGTGQSRRLGWDYDTHRLEVGVGYWITDGVLTKGALQLNDLQGTPGADILAGLQLPVAF